MGVALRVKYRMTAVLLPAEYDSMIHSASAGGSVHQLRR